MHYQAPEDLEKNFNAYYQEKEAYRARGQHTIGYKLLQEKTELQTESGP